MGSHLLSTDNGQALLALDNNRLFSLLTINLLRKPNVSVPQGPQEAATIVSDVSLFSVRRALQDRTRASEENMDTTLVKKYKPGPS